MSNIDPEQAAAVHQVTALAQVLYEALELQDPQQILSAQQNLTAVAEMFWTRVNQDASVSGRDKAILRLLAGGAIKELPVAIQDPANYPKIQHDLRVLKSSLVLLK
jgi:hypothetical protein